MFDSQKIDSYFDGKHNLEPQTYIAEQGGVSWRRVFKLSLPCVAAALLGLMIVMPNIRKSVDLQDSITLPRKNEMEKLHIEQTVFSSTDNKNRINKLLADNVEETVAGSKIMDIANPRAAIPTDSGFVNISSQKGSFNQNDNILNLKNNVKAVVDGSTVITTSLVYYDFNNEKGWGDERVEAKGEWGTLEAKAFTFDKKTELLTLKGYNKIVGKGGTLSAQKETQVFQKENKTVSIGGAAVEKDGKTLKADKIIGYFSDSSNKDLVRAEAFGNVVVVSAGETATGKEGFYNPSTGEVILYGSSSDDKNKSGRVSLHQGENVLYAEKITAYLAKDGQKNLQKVVALGNVKVITPGETAVGKEGHYNPEKGEITLYGDFLTSPDKKGYVTIKQGDNTLRAEKIIAYLDMNGKRDLQKAVAVGKVSVTTPSGTAKGDRGVYNPKQNKVELFDNVRIEQNGNFITGAYAETDLLTSVSKISGGKNNGGRIRGIFYKTRKVNNGKQAKK